MDDARALTVPVRISRTEAAVICEIGADGDAGLMVGYFRDQTPWTNAQTWAPDDDATGWSGEEGG